MAEAARELFSKAGRSYLGTIEYADVQASAAPAVALRLKRLSPEAVYIDGQPAGLANIMKRILETKQGALTVLTNDIGRDMLADRLVDGKRLKNFYYSTRETVGPEFAAKFKKRYGREPYLNADMGYFGLKILVAALSQKDPVGWIKQGLQVEGVDFRFDQKNVLTGLKHRIWRVAEGEILPVK